MTSESNSWLQRLETLGLEIQRHATRRAPGDIADAVPVAHVGGDSIFAIDRAVEPLLLKAIEGWREACSGLVVVAEGFEGGRKEVTGLPGGPCYRVIVDPIDGTRLLMYDKRAGWFLAAVAHDRGEATSLADTFAAVMVELPTSKQAAADVFCAAVGEPVRGRRLDLLTGEARSLTVRPSDARDLRFGFGQVSSFFPGTKVLAAQLMERIALDTVGAARPGEALVFEDQYMSSGGQMVELMTGRDRFTCDLRPLFLDIVERRSGTRPRGLECHPYDVAGLLVASQAGVIITDGFGRPLDCPLDVTTGVHWCGYANETIAQSVQTVVLKWLEEYGIRPT